VKTSSKTFWENLLNDKRVDHTAYISDAKTQIRTTKQYEGPIPCKCSTPCSKKEAEKGKKISFTEHEVRMIEGLQGHIDDMY
jgi:hypothetical protein